MVEKSVTFIRVRACAYASTEKPVYNGHLWDLCIMVTLGTYKSGRYIGGDVILQSGLYVNRNKIGT